MSKFEKYFRAVENLQSLENLGDRKHGMGQARNEESLQRMRYWLKMLGNPEKGQNIIHITGTSGKGSVTSLLHTIFTHAGFRTGSFYSPYTTTSIELIKYNSGLIPPDAFAALAEELSPLVDKAARECPYGRPQYYEIIIGMALLYFQRQRCDYTILEVLSGGLYDPTNAVDNGIATVITNIGLDHVETLGSTKEEIAANKSGLIKEGHAVFTTEEDKDIRSIIENKTKDVNAHFHFIETKGAKNIRIQPDSMSFAYKNDAYQMKSIGKHQIKNALLARAVADSFDIPDKAIQKGIQTGGLPARIEVMQKNPLVILDGAHNEAKIDALIETIQEMNYFRLHLVFGLTSSKDANTITGKLIEIADDIYVTRYLATHKPVHNPFDLEKLCKEKGFNGKSYVSLNPYSALQEALDSATPRDIVLVTGSLYLAGDLRKYWIPEEKILKKKKSR